MKDSTGAAMVEMSLMLPFLLTLGFGIFVFSHYFNNHHIIATGVRDAARYLARFDDPDAQSAKGRQLAVTGEIAGGTPRFDWWNAENVIVDTRKISNPVDRDSGERAYRGRNPILIVKVSTDVDYKDPLGLLSALGLGKTFRISVAHEERVIGE